MAKDIHKDDNRVRYKVKCQGCSQTFLVYEISASVPEHPAPNNLQGEPYGPCPGSNKAGSLIKTIPKKR